MSPLVSHPSWPAVIAAAALVLLGVVMVRLGRRMRLADARRKAVERRLRVSETIARSVTDTAVDAVLTTDADGIVTLYNPGARRLFGWTADEVLGRPVSAILPEPFNDIQDVGRLLERRARTKSGAEIDVELALGAFHRDEQRGFTAIVRDITERKRFERLARADADRLARVVEAQTAIASAPDIRAMRTVVAECAVDLIGGDGAMVSVPDDDMLVYRAGAGIAREHVGTRLSADHSLIGEALRTGLTLSCIDTEEDPRVDRDGARAMGIRSVLCVALKHDGDVVGVLEVVARRTNAFTRGEERTLELLAGLVGSSLHRSRVERRLAAHAAVARALAEATASAPGLEAALRGAGEHLGWDVGLVWLRTTDHGVLRCVGTWHHDEVAAGPSLDACRAQTLAPGEGIAGQVWRDGAADWIDDLGRRDDACLAAAREVGMATQVCVPIVSHGEILGALTFQARERRPRTADTVALLHDLAAQIGQFVHRAEGEERLAHSASNLAAVVKLAREASRLDDPTEVRPVLVDAIAEITEATQVSLFEPGGPGLRLVGQRGGLLPEDFTVDVSEDVISAEAFRMGQSRFINDLSTDVDAARRPGARAGLKTAYAEPLLRDGQVVGVLTVAWDHRRGPDPDGMGALVKLLASEAAGALERADLVAALDANARTDQLTGTANRRAWDAALPREVDRARRAGASLTVAILDLDHFKTYNDTYGHPAGDRLLRETAARWSARLRSTDLLARYGGEEFAVLLPGCTEQTSWMRLDELRRAMPAGVTCSIGFASWNGEEDGDALLARADAALYEAKRAGRDRVVRASPDISVAR